MSLAGLHSFEAAERCLSEALICARDGSVREYVEMNTLAARARILLMQGDAEQALALTSPRWVRIDDPAMHAELETTRALALCALGRHKSGREVAAAATRRSRTVEAVALQLAIFACIALSTGDEALMSPEDAYTRAQEIRAEDAFVVAYRCFPQLTTRLLNSDRASAGFRDLLKRSNDTTSAGIDPSPPPLPAKSLTLREQHLAELLLLGLSNRELAESLYLSESTVKLHLQHIYRKLGTRNRTETVLKLLQRCDRPQ